MRSFACEHCDHLVFFENSVCLHCDTPLGFSPERLALVALESEDALGSRCANAATAACNWIVEDGNALCRSCELTRTRPNDGDVEAMRGFQRAEAAKRRAIFQMLDLGMPGIDRHELCFDLLSSGDQPVTTGHSDGVITIDLAESDDARREERRQQLSEPYRTMLGHLRHELGHYLQPPLIGDATVWSRCRALFGDERQDYQAAVELHYERGAPPDWEEGYVSAYATTHPWEDWAETFAHYLHIRDTLQTAAEFGVTISGPRAVGTDRSLMASPQPEPAEQSFAEMLDNWLPLTYALNAVNRSMGHDDLYPFTLAPAVINKLAFVHERVCAASRPRGREPRQT